MEGCATRLLALEYQHGDPYNVRMHKVVWCLFVSLAFSALGEETNEFYYSSAGRFIKTSNTNCLVWNSFPKEGESVTWTGGVVDGKSHGKGLLQWFTNGVPTSSYEGEMKDGYADGQGVSKAPIFSVEGKWATG